MNKVCVFFVALLALDEKVKVVDFLPLGFGSLGTYWGLKSRFEVGKTKEKKKQLSSSSSLPGYKTTF